MKTFLLLCILSWNFVESVEAVPSFYWYIYVIDNSGNVGESSSIKYDSNGLLHLAYRDIGNGNLVKYAVQNGVNWNINYVDTEIFSGGGKVALALDSLDNPHLVYHKYDGRWLIYAYKSGNNWVKVPVDSALRDNRFYGIDISVGVNNIKHICYEKHDPNTEIESITYATILKQSLLTNIPIDQGFTGKWNDLIVDNYQRPSVAYYDFNGPQLAFSYLEQGEWHKDIVGSNEEGYYPALAQGIDDNYYIAFQNHSNSVLKLAIGQPNNWTVEEITPIFNWTEFSTTNPLVLDDQSRPYIGFYDGRDNSLNLASKGSNEWNFQKIDSIGDVGEWASMAISPNGLPAISYYDRSNGYLKLALASISPILDSDQDGLPDYIEELLGTNSLDLDSDDDGIADGKEDLNHNEFVDAFETSPILFDTDGDGLSDGLEKGIKSLVPDPDGAGPLMGTDINYYQSDLDTSSRTDPLNFDSDSDGLSDGQEDINHNGAIDDWESDPLKKDTDGDGVRDDNEFSLGTNPLDLDTDDDGLSDNLEDYNSNGIIDADETSPISFDTDGDSLGDGLELGKTVGLTDPDGFGPLKGTNVELFFADEDTNTNSNPILFDTDFDGLSDGEEDQNRNGSVDPGETNYLVSDSDGDGFSDGDEVFFNSNSLNNMITPKIDTILAENYNTISKIPQSWTAIDEGSLEGPSYWFINEHTITQGTNIYDLPTNPGPESQYRAGTYLLLDNRPLLNYKIELNVQSRNSGEIGIKFNYLDPNNFDCLAMNREYNYIRLLEVIDGKTNLIDWQQFVYEPFRWYGLKIYSINSSIKIYLDDKRIFDYQNSDLTSGYFAYYCWKNPVAMFDDLKIVSDSTITFLPEHEIRFIKDFSSNFNKGEIQLQWEVNYSPKISYIEIEKVSNQGFDLIKHIDNQGHAVSRLKGTLQISKPGHFNAFRLVVYSSSGEIIDEQISKQTNTVVNQIYLYPNPVSKQLNVSLGNVLAGQLYISIYDLLGRRISYSQEDLQASGEKVLQIDLQNKIKSELASGFYFVQLLFADKRTGKILSTYFQKILILR